MDTSSGEAPKLTVRWFHAVDVPKLDNTPFRVATTTNSSKQPASWKPFSEKDSAKLEDVYQKHVRCKKLEKNGEKPTQEVQTKVPVNEDHLFEADVAKMETYPVYWHGPTYDIRRGTWFNAAFGGNWLPCDENLSRQLEDGYRKFQPWQSTISPTSQNIPQSVSSSQSSPASSTEHVNKTGDSKDTKEKPQEQRWALFGPYMNQYVVYTGPHTALQFSDLVTMKIGRAMMNIGGTKLLRGWDEVEKLKKKAKAQNPPAAVKGKDAGKKETGTEKDKSKSSNEALAEKESADDVQTDPAAELANKNVSMESFIAGITPASATRSLTKEQAEDLQRKTESEDYSAAEDGDRPINHLVLVIHGIGQKLGERVEAVNFVHDCNVLRRTMKDSSRQYVKAKAQLKASKLATAVNMPDDGGVQVLPVQWRQKIQFGISPKKDGESGDNEDTTLEDITLEGVQSIRQLVSDVVLDVLLYMTPRYRQEMVKYVTEELNRIYRLFKERNPKFNGKVSILGHSLGSLLAFDILCHQGKETLVVAPPTPGAKGPKEVDLTDMLDGAVRDDDRRVKGLMDKPALQYTPLEFDVDRLFVMGSPVGLFLLLKGDKLIPRSPGMMLFEEDAQSVSSPAVNAIYNIFHPHDPVAYRIEPIIKRAFASHKPVPIPYTKGGLKGTIVGIQDLGNDIADKGRSMLVAARMGFAATTATVSLGVSSGLGKVVGIVSSINAFKTSVKVGEQADSPIGDEVTASMSQAESLSAPGTSKDGIEGKEDVSMEMQDMHRPLPELSDDEAPIELFNPRGRIDYVLQEGVLENPYISALGVHMNYWADPDCALFMLRELYADFEDPKMWVPPTGSDDGGNGGSNSGKKGNDSDSSHSNSRHDSPSLDKDKSQKKPDKDRGHPPAGTFTKTIRSYLRDPMIYQTGMTPDDLNVFNKAGHRLRLDMSAPIVYPTGPSDSIVDGYSLL
ncbi:hypothetical protein HDU85_006827 [Gaertneriomyces sp. JEL0708]|nr:hypothetical protein HDU85_006827 [Gaertneriomyces sp. JEL0708]